MKIYQLQFHHHNYEEGLIITSGRTYTTREEAEKAKAFVDSIPDDPCDYRDIKTVVAEIEVEEEFTPWIPQAVVDRMRKEVEEYWEREASMHRCDYDPYDDPAM